MQNADTLFQNILNVVCSHFSVTLEELRGRGGKKVIAEPRHIAVYFLYKHVKGITQQKIADYFNRDHSTIINSIRCVNDWNYTNKAFKSQFEFLEREVLKALTN